MLIIWGIFCVIYVASLTESRHLTGIRSDAATWVSKSLTESDISANQKSGTTQKQLHATGDVVGNSAGAKKSSGKHNSDSFKQEHMSGAGTHINSRIAGIHSDNKNRPVEEIKQPNSIQNHLNVEHENNARTHLNNADTIQSKGHNDHVEIVSENEIHNTDHRENNIPVKLEHASVQNAIGNNFNSKESLDNTQNTKTVIEEPNHIHNHEIQQLAENDSADRRPSADTVEMHEPTIQHSEHNVKTEETLPNSVKELQANSNLPSESELISHTNMVNPNVESTKVTDNNIDDNAHEAVKVNSENVHGSMHNEDVMSNNIETNIHAIKDVYLPETNIDEQNAEKVHVKGISEHSEHPEDSDQLEVHVPENNMAVIPSNAAAPPENHVDTTASDEQLTTHDINEKPDSDAHMTPIEEHGNLATSNTHLKPPETSYNQAMPDAHITPMEEHGNIATSNTLVTPPEASDNQAMPDAHITPVEEHGNIATSNTHVTPPETSDNQAMPDAHMTPMETRSHLATSNAHETPPETHGNLARTNSHVTQPETSNNQAMPVAHMTPMEAYRNLAASNSPETYNNQALPDAHMVPPQTQYKPTSSHIPSHEIRTKLSYLETTPTQRTTRPATTVPRERMSTRATAPRTTAISERPSSVVIRESPDNEVIRESPDNEDVFATMQPAHVTDDWPEPAQVTESWADYETDVSVTNTAPTPTEHQPDDVAPLDIFAKDIKYQRFPRPMSLTTLKSKVLGRRFKKLYVLEESEKKLFQHVRQLEAIYSIEDGTLYVSLLFRFIYSRQCQEIKRFKLGHVVGNTDLAMFEKELQDGKTERVLFFSDRPSDYVFFMSCTDYVTSPYACRDTYYITLDSTHDPPNRFPWGDAARELNSKTGLTFEDPRFIFNFVLLPCARRPGPTPSSPTQPARRH